MAPSTRRSTRKTPATLPVSEDSMDIEQSDKSVGESCPACEDHEDAGDKAVWIRCDSCKTWFHWACVGDGDDHEQVDKWFCKSCHLQDSTRVNTLKPPARKSTRKKARRDYASLNEGLDSDVNRWLHVLETKPIQENQFHRMKGSDVGIEWLEADDNAMREPILIDDPEGLGLKMPPKGLTVQDVASSVGEDTVVDVIDVVSQSNSPNWTLGKWAEYYMAPPEERDRIRNVISLEISGTKLAEKVVPPRLVRELDWVDRFWPSTRKQKGSFPKVQLYCLMSVANCWTDWHIDFAGSSVYYHIYKGSKVFYFIEPTSANLAAYEKWSGTDMQNHTWLGDLVDKVVKVELEEGNTMIIPTGWIHAVYTPSDSLVFGGNFLHSYNIATQIRVREIEIATRVPKKFTFPLFQRLCWYVAERYLRDLRAKEDIPRRILEGLDALATFLVIECRAMDRGPESTRKDTREQVPSDKIKDPAALSRELRWRVRLAAGGESGDELLPRNASVSLRSNGNKRKRENGHLDSREGSLQAPVKFRHWTPKPWDVIDMKPSISDKRITKQRRPLAEEDLSQWAVEGESNDNVAESSVDTAEFETRTSELIRLRRLNDGKIEREIVTRVIQLWEWPDSKLQSSTKSKNDPQSPIQDL